MKLDRSRLPHIIFAAYFVLTAALLLLGYSVRRPAVDYQEFPFSFTYSYQGEQTRVDGVFVGEHLHRAKYLGDSALAWNGYLADHDRLQSDYYTLIETADGSFSLNTHLHAGFLMGDPAHADVRCAPEAVYHDFASGEEITDPAQLEALGFRLLSWEYPTPIENSFRFGGICLSGEAALLACIPALAALLACLFLIRRESGARRSRLDRVSAVLNGLLAFVFFPFVLAFSMLSEILSETGFFAQLTYLLPSLTLLGIALSVTLRRFGRGKASLAVQFTGPVLLAVALLGGAG